MLVTEFYDGQGLGNQLWSYVSLRCIALYHGYDFGIISPDKFKGKEFIDLDFGQIVKLPNNYNCISPPGFIPDGFHYFLEQRKYDIFYLCDVSNEDSSIYYLDDNTKIDGYFQSELFISKYKSQISTWIKWKSLDKISNILTNNLCILNIRGGEYLSNSQLLLRKSYWENAMRIVENNNKNVEFKIVTDDKSYCNKLFPNIEVLNLNLHESYEIIFRVKKIIISNSSFAFFPVWLSSKEIVICPKYWARHNISSGFWCTEQNIVEGWQWLDRKGKLFTAKECRNELNNYQINKLKIYSNKLNNKNIFYRIYNKYLNLLSLLK